MTVARRASAEVSHVARASRSAVDDLVTTTLGQRSDSRLLLLPLRNVTTTGARFEFTAMNPTMRCSATVPSRREFHVRRIMQTGTRRLAAIRRTAGRRMRNEDYGSPLMHRCNGVSDRFSSGQTV